MPHTIYLYNGPGTSAVSLEHTVYSLNKLIPTALINMIGAADTIKGDWVHDADLLIMPGGADTAYCRALNGQGNAIISQFVNAGGSYLGLCAGAYYGTEQIKFSSNTDLEITGHRELKFLKGTAEGPTLAPYNYQSNSGARCAVLKWHDDKSQDPFTAFFNGGCHFNIGDGNNHLEILASFLNEMDFKNKPTVIKIKVGHGTVILSGVHIEYAVELLDQTDPDIIAFLDDLKKYDGRRQEFLKNVLSKLGVNI